MPQPTPTEAIGRRRCPSTRAAPDEAAAVADRLTARTREDGSPLGHAIAAMLRGMIALEAGDLRAADAELADARLGAPAASRHGSP